MGFQAALKRLSFTLGTFVVVSFGVMIKGKCQDRSSLSDETVGAIHFHLCVRIRSMAAVCFIIIHNKIYLSFLWLILE